ncbi:MAG TPA: 2-dehydro-3-deoxygalactonokinase [Blastocatellia bacterium]|nr:2-dehydro-3-deoxygalactonokinase [Blastocatellia bacterium]
MSQQDDFCAIYIDTGTTNSRVWLMRGAEVLAKANAQIGVRDSAKDGSTERLRAALRDLIAAVRLKARAETSQAAPACVVAAGMITSSLGLADVPHIAAPAGLAELAAATRVHHFPEVTDLPVLLVPGVYSGQKPCDLATVGEADLMRGEETMCAGLLMLGTVSPPATILNLGSHWKAIRLDAAGRIAGSITSLSGEMVHTTQTQTILASAVSHERPEQIDWQWLAAGIQRQRQSGLARALFGVRLLEQSGQGSPQQRLDFLLGAFIAADLDALQRAGVLADAVFLTGGGALAVGGRF